MHTDCWIGDAADNHYSNNWRTMETLQISKCCFFRVLLSKKEKQCGKLSLNSKLLRTDWWFR